jgi:signal transduction histidine kinase/DNA-binding response OmpR family regulator
VAASNEMDNEAGWKPELLFAAFDHSRDFYVLTEDGLITRANAPWRLVMGTEEATAEPMRFADFVHEEDREKLARLDGLKPREVDVRLMAPTGSLVNGRMWAQALGGGSILMIVRELSEAYDVAAAQAGRQALAALRDAADISLWRWSPETLEYTMDLDFGRPTETYDTDSSDASVRSRRLDGVRKVEEIVSHPDDVERVNESFTRTARTGEVDVIEYRRQRPEGGWAHLRSAWRGFLRTPNGWEVLGLTLDVSELAEARNNALAAAEAKSQFLANMSHEIRTPMNGIIGMNALLLRGDLTTEQRKFAEAVRVSADCLLGIINDILDISKLEAGKVELEEIDFSLETVVEDVVELLSPKAQDKALEIASYLDDGARQPFKGDPTRLRQILLNLLSNSLKFTERGFVSVEVRSRPAEDGRTGLRIEVHDTGIGLTQEARGKLFKKFQQADGSITRRFGGTGLGLSICRQLVDLMGGDIGVDDRTGGGSTFWVDLTLENAAAPVAERQRPRNGLAGVRILVVDDIELNRSIFARQLEADGAVVSEADGGAACLTACAKAQAQGQPFDIVLMDHMMPDLSGDAVAEHIRAKVDWRQPKLVLASSIGVPLSTDSAAKAGFDAFLTKPVRHQMLVDCLAGLMGTPEPTAEATPAPIETPVALGRGRILLADDNDINSLLATTLLEEAGYAVECAINGLEAVEAARTRDFDLILMDVQMPQMDGLEATRRIRALEAPARDVPIVAMTANAMRQDHDACLAAGMNDFVSKPIELDAFLNTVARFMPAPTTAEASPGEGLSGEVPVDLDEAQLDGLARLLPAARLRTIVESYLAAAETRLRRVETLAAELDFSEIAREAHDLKGVSGNFGAKRLQALAERLENVCKAKDETGMYALVVEIRRAAIVAWDLTARRLAIADEKAA